MWWLLDINKVFTQMFLLQITLYNKYTAFFVN